MVDVSAAGSIDPGNSVQPEHLADAVVQIVEHGAKRLRRIGGGLLIEQLVRRGCTGPGGQLLGQILGQSHELLVVGDGGRLAQQLDHGPDAGLQVDRHPARRGFAVGAFVHRLLAGFAQQFDGRIFIAARLLQGLFAVHHGQARPLAQGFHRCRRDIRH